MKKLLYGHLLLFVSLNAFSMGTKAIDWDRAVELAITKYGIPTKPELKRQFRKSGIKYPPKKIALLAFKKEQALELWAKNPGKTWHHIHTYPLTANSGHLGPKLKRYDKQIPEGIYKLTSFNPYSKMHLSMRINYPNGFDKAKAKLNGRKKLGGDIFLHGKDASVGCLAVGDHSINQLFMLTHEVGLKNVQLIIAPNDMRHSKPLTNFKAQPKWVPELYADINKALQPFG